MEESQNRGKARGKAFGTKEIVESFPPKILMQLFDFTGNEKSTPTSGFRFLCG